MSGVYCGGWVSWLYDRRETAVPKWEVVSILEGLGRHKLLNGQQVFVNQASNGLAQAVTGSNIHLVVDFHITDPSV